MFEKGSRYFPLNFVSGVEENRDIRGIGWKRKRGRRKKGGPSSKPISSGVAAEANMRIDVEKDEIPIVVR